MSKASTTVSVYRKSKANADLSFCINELSGEQLVTWIAQPPLPPPHTHTVTVGAHLICGNSWNTACYKSEPKTLHFVSKAVFPVAVHDGWVNDSFSYFLLRSLRKYLKQINPAKLRFHFYCMFYNWWLYRRTQHWWAFVAVRFQMSFMLFSPGLPSTTNVVMSFFVCSDSRIEYL